LGQSDPCVVIVTQVSVAVVTGRGELLGVLSFAKTLARRTATMVANV